MKQSTIFSRILLLGLILMLALVACEQPTEGAVEQENNAKATQAAIDAGVVEEPTTAPVPVEPTAVIEQPVEPVIAPTVESGEASEGDTSDAVDPTAVPDAGGNPDTDAQAGGGVGDDTSITPAPPTSNGGTYTVSAGENFFRIGYNKGCSIAQMAAVNPAVVPPNYTIYIGQTLVIPTCR